MTEEILVTKTTVFVHRTNPAIYAESVPADSPYSLTNKKRLVTHRWCSRLEAGKLPGSELAVEYIQGKYIKNHSVHTIVNSSRIILYFYIFLARNGTTIYAVTRKHISAYAEYEQDRGLKPQSVVNHLRVVYAFLVFLVDQDILSQEIMQRKIRIKLPDALPRAIPSEDIERLREAITTVRDNALILLLLRTGMRIGELLEVKVNDISFVERKILIYLGEKNMIGRAVYYSEDAEQALQEWLKKKNNDSAYLFPGNSGRPNICYMTARKAMLRILGRAGLSGKGYSLHSLRHTFATDMLNAGMRVEVLQQLLGHQEIEMTMRYARITDLTREHEYFKAMDRIEQGDQHESCRVSSQLQKVFEEKKLLTSKHK